MVIGGAGYPDWEGAAGTTAEILRAAAGRDPNDRELSDLVGELATKSDAFRTRWAVHNVRFHAAAVKRPTEAEPERENPGVVPNACNRAAPFHATEQQSAI